MPFIRAAEAELGDKIELRFKKPIPEADARQALEALRKGGAEKAMQLNPHHPGWYRFAAYNDAFRRGDDRGALESAPVHEFVSLFVV